MFEKLYEALVDNGLTVDKATVLSEIWQSGGEEMMAELYALYCCH